MILGVRYTSSCSNETNTLAERFKGGRVRQHEADQLTYPYLLQAGENDWTLASNPLLRNEEQHTLHSTVWQLTVLEGQSDCLP